jgi:hypothetical protein
MPPLSSGSRLAFNLRSGASGNNERNVRMIILRDAVISLAVALAIVCAIDAFKWAEARVPSASQVLERLAP